MNKHDYQNAMAAQSACNLVAIVGTFHRALKKLLEETQSTEKVCNHAISKLYAEQIAWLTRNKDYSEAYQETLDEIKE